MGSMAGRGLLFRLSEEIGRELAEAGLDGNAPRAARAYALVYVAHYEAYIASQDAKFHYWTARPNQFDPSITTVVPNPNHPTYPSNAAAVGMAPHLCLAICAHVRRRATWAGRRSSESHGSGRGSTSGATWRRAGR